jgi:hypothetical protein
MSEDAPQPVGRRRPKDGDLKPLLTLLWDGKSLRSACAELGLDTPSTDKWLHDDDDRRQQYVRACAGRSDFLQEDGLAMNRAAALGTEVDGKKVDAAGARGYMDAVKFAIGRMHPKSLPVQRFEHHHEYGSLDDDELDRRIAAREAALAGGVTAADDEAETD